MDQRLTRYLLRELTFEEEHGVEEQYFTDPALHERLLVLEDELIDSYVADELSPSRRELFEERFLCTPERREKVDLARSLSNHVKLTSSAAGQATQTPIRVLRNIPLAAGVATLLCGAAYLTLRQVEYQKLDSRQSATVIRPAPATVATRANPAGPTEQYQIELEGLEQEARQRAQGLAGQELRSRDTAAGGGGIVEIVTAPPGASVRVNGGPTCTSNCVLSLAPGNYQVAAFLDGYEAAAAGFSIQNGRESSISITLKPRGRVPDIPGADKGVPPSESKPQVTEGTPRGNTNTVPSVISPQGNLSFVLHGKVVMEDGSPPPRTVSLERICRDPVNSAPGPITNRNGEWLWRMEGDPTKTSCVVRANLRGYTSTAIDISGLNSYSEPTFPDLVLTASSVESEDPAKWRFIALSSRIPAARDVPLPPGIEGLVLGSGSCPNQRCSVLSFTVALPQLMNGRFRWAANYIDAKNYALFEVDKQNLWAWEMTDGKLLGPDKVRLHHERDAFQIHMEVAPDHITHVLEEHLKFLRLHSWAKPNGNFAQGQIGLLVDKN